MRQTAELAVPGSTLASARLVPRGGKAYHVTLKHILSVNVNFLLRQKNNVQILKYFLRILDESFYMLHILYILYSVQYISSDKALSKVDG